MAHLVYNPLLKRETLCIKKGKTKDGKQKYLCKETNKIFVEVDKFQQIQENVKINDEKKKENVKVTVQNFNFEVALKKVTLKNKKINKKKLLNALVDYIFKNAEVVEMNDLHMFVKVK